MDIMLLVGRAVVSSLFASFYFTWYNGERDAPSFFNERFVTFKYRMKICLTALALSLLVQLRIFVVWIIYNTTHLYVFINTVVLAVNFNNRYQVVARSIITVKTTAFQYHSTSYVNWFQSQQIIVTNNNCIGSTFQQNTIPFENNSGIYIVISNTGIHCWKQSKDTSLIDKQLSNDLSVSLKQHKQQKLQKESSINNSNKVVVVSDNTNNMMKRRSFLLKTLVAISVGQILLDTIKINQVLAFPVVRLESKTTESISSSSSFMLSATTSNNNEPIITTESAFPSLTTATSLSSSSSSTILYKPLQLPLPKFGITVPVAAWFPSDFVTTTTTTEQNVPIATYKHRISVRKIGQLLVKWNWIPTFVSKEYNMDPTGVATTTSTTIAKTESSSSSKIKVLSGETISLQSLLSNTNDAVTLSSSSTKQYPIIILAHGYLGSRFDLSHLAEELASQGFICIAAEYPESLAASYDSTAKSTTGSTTTPNSEETVTRQYITTELLRTMEDEWNIIPKFMTTTTTTRTKFGIIGHSLGTGTVFTTGDDTWTRVVLAGFPGERFRTTKSKITGQQQIPDALFISSMNDSLTKRFGGSTDSYVQESFVLVDESDAKQTNKRLPTRAAIIFDRPDGPNHISFLAGSVNNAMIEFLSPLLPVAQVLKIPVLDFDKYKISQDSIPTAAIVHPIIVKYLKQEMNLL